MRLREQSRGERQNRVADSDGRHTKAAFSKSVSMGIGAAEASVITEIMMKTDSKTKQKKDIRQVRITAENTLICIVYVWKAGHQASPVSRVKR